MKKEKGKVDRRVQRTRQLLREALMALVVEKGYEAITVQNIIDRANLGRSTFYAHYQDKEDLLLSGMAELVHSIIWRVESLPKDEGKGESSRILSTVPLFQHTQTHHRLYQAMVGKQGIDVVIKTTHNHLSGHVQEQLTQLLPEDQNPSVPLPVIANYLAGTLLTLLTWWLDHDMPYPPERMDEIFQQLTIPGVWLALGITNVSYDKLSNFIN